MNNNGKTYVDIMCFSKEVTGSGHLIVAKFPNGTTVNTEIDYGLFQESKYLKYNNSIQFYPKKLSALVITHNHIDHTGRIPNLALHDLKCNILMTERTSCFIRSSLKNSYGIAKNEAKRNGTVCPYNINDLEKSFKLMKGFPYSEEIEIHENVHITFFENGHSTGAAIIYVRVSYPGEKDINILFSGDYSHHNDFFKIKKIPKHILNLPLTIVMESTYAKTNSKDTIINFEENVVNAINESKTVIIPSIAFDRTAQVLLKIKKIQRSGKLSNNLNVYVAGHSSIENLNFLFKLSDSFKAEAKDFLPKKTKFITLKKQNDKKAMNNYRRRNNKQKRIHGNMLEICIDREISKEELLADKNPKIIIASGGNGSNGSSPEYIREYINREDALVQFVSYRVPGTISRKLNDTRKGDFIKIYGQNRLKLCDVDYTEEFSKHDKLDEILIFLKRFKDIRLLLANHGEYDCRENLVNQAIINVKVKDAAIEDRSIFYRIDNNGLIGKFSSNFKYATFIC